MTAIGTVSATGRATSGKLGTRVQPMATTLIASITTLTVRRDTRRNTSADVPARIECAPATQRIRQADRRIVTTAPPQRLALDAPPCNIKFSPDCSNENLFAPMCQTGRPDFARPLVGCRAERLLAARAERLACESAADMARWQCACHR